MKCIRKAAAAIARCASGIAIVTALGAGIGESGMAVYWAARSAPCAVLASLAFATAAACLLAGKRQRAAVDGSGA